MKSKRNLTRFTYENAAFQGWRVCVTKAGSTFTKYFSDKKFGSNQASLKAAEKLLAHLKKEIAKATFTEGKLSQKSQDHLKAIIEEHHRPPALTKH